MTSFNKQISCIDCTKKSSCFSKLSKTDFQFIEKNRLELNFKNGEVICKQGSFASNIMFVYKGLVKTYLETSLGHHVVLDIIPEGNMIGLSSLFSDSTFNQSAMAINDSTICSINIKVFEEYTKLNGEFASELINILNNDTKHTNQRFLSLTHKQLNGKLADALIFLSEKVYMNSTFDLTLMRKDLAELTNMSPESVTRVINAFKKDRIIRITGVTYEILNMEALKKISEVG